MFKMKYLDPKLFHELEQTQFMSSILDSFLSTILKSYHCIVVQVTFRLLTCN